MPALRLVVAVVVALLLARAAVAAWQQRALAVSVWRRVRIRHVAGAFGLLVVVAGLGTLLLEVPVLRLGLGDIVGSAGNAVFVPFEEVAARAPIPDAGPDWVIALLATVFLGFLALLLPWLAFVEEEVFRAGLEGADLRREVLTAVVFGLVHMVMLVPLAAALAIAVAGFAYGRIYRRAFEHGTAVDVPTAIAQAYRPTRRAVRALASRQVVAEVAVAGGGSVALAEPSPVLVDARRQAGAVLTSTVWHATFNSLIVVVLWLFIVVDALILV